MVIGIHTEPFGFNVWLDRGFGIITRLCVPFFFVTSAYLYWLKQKSPLAYIKRIFLLYMIWSVVYLPFDIKSLSQMSISSIFVRFFWNGNEHALWYLCGSIIGFIITFLLLKVWKPKTVLVTSVVFLIIGCAKSTWAPMFEKLLHVTVSDWLGSRNGLFYAFPYTALGMYIAKSSKQGKTVTLSRPAIGFLISVVALMVESLLFVLVFHAKATILWITVFPYTYFTFMLVNNIGNSIKKEKLRFLRKCSTLMYVSQYLFIPLFEKWLKNVPLFIVTSVTVFLFSAIIIRLSETKYGRFLKYLY